MSIKAIVYTSNTGHTERYAKMFGEKTGYPVYSVKEADNALAKNDEIFYFGWLFASIVKGYARVKKNIMSVPYAASDFVPRVRFLTRCEKTHKSLRKRLCLPFRAAWIAARFAVSINL